MFLYLNYKDNKHSLLLNKKLWFIMFSSVAYSLFSARKMAFKFADDTKQQVELWTATSLSLQETSAQ